MGGTLELITVFTDAGYCEHIRRGTYAVWAKMDGKTLRKSGVLKGEVPSASIAELRAIANGIFAVICFFAPKPGAKIILQSDCLGIINALIGTGYKRPSARAKVKAECELIQKTLAEKKLYIEYRHVPGHRGYKNIRTSVNTWCDQQCTLHLRAARKEAEKNAVS